MSRSARILKNIASNWTGSAVNAAVIFFLTPLVLHELGQGRYGIWVLSSSVVGYYGMLDLGFRAGVNQHLTRTLAVPDYERASDVISTAMAGLSALGVLMGALSLAAAYLVPNFFNLPAGLRDEAFWCILIIGATAAVQCTLSPFGGIFVATQRFDLANVIGIGSRLLSAAGVVTALVFGYGLVGVAAATALGTVIDYLTRSIVARRLVPELTVSRSRVHFGTMRKIGTFGLWNFLISVTRYVNVQVQPLLIGALMPVAAVGHYALATGLWLQINGLFTPIGQVLYPAAAHLDVQGDRDTLRRLYQDGTRLVLLVVVPVVLMAIVWADDFYRLWIGDKYLSGHPFASVAQLLRVLLLGTVLGYTSNVASQILTACGHIGRVAQLQIVGAVVNLTLSLALINTIGLMGFAVASVLGAALIDFLGIPLAISQTVGIRFRDFLRAATVRPAVVSLFVGVAFVAIRQLSQPDDWAQLILHGLTASCVAVVICLSLGVTPEERDRFVVRPLRRIAARRAWGHT